MVHSTNFIPIDQFSYYSPMQSIEVSDDESQQSSVDWNTTCPEPTISSDKNCNSIKVGTTTLRINLKRKLPEESLRLDSDAGSIAKQVTSGNGSHQNKIKIKLAKIDHISVPVDDINELTQEELINYLHNPNGSTAVDRFQTLLKAFTDIPYERFYRALWVKLPDTVDRDESYMYLTIEESTYYSQCFEEEDQYPGMNSPTDQRYYYINAYDHNDKRNLYFRIRINKDCSSAEIIHIKSDDKITGTEVKGSCMSILNYIRPETCVLYDDSKIVSKGRKKYMRLYMPIVSESPKTWYSGDNFKVFNMDTPLQFKGKKIPDQRVDRYYIAVNTIRSTKMATIPVQDTRKIPTRFLPYLSDTQKQNLDNITVHDVGRAIFQELKRVNFDETSTVSHAFSFFYEKYVATTDQRISSIYTDALHVLDSTKIWIQVNRSFDQ